MREEEELARAAGLEGPSALLPRPMPPTAAEPAEAAAPDPTKPPVEAPAAATYEPPPPDLPDPEQNPPGFDASALEPKEEDVWARFSRTRGAPPDIGAPPMMKDPSSGHTIAAMVIEGLVNKGRGIPGMLMAMGEKPDVEYENWMRRAKAAQAQQGLENAYAQSLRPGGADPLTLDLRRRNLALREAQISTAQDREERLRQKQREMLDPDSDLAKQVRTFLRSEGVDTTNLERLSVEAMRNDVDPAIKHKIDYAFRDQIAEVAGTKAGAVAEATIAPSVAKARQTAEATADTKVDVAGRSAAAVAEATQPYKLELDAAKREGTRAIEDSKRGEDFAWKYAKEVEKDLGIAKLMDGIDASGGAVPESLAERFNNWITNQVIPEERMKPWQAKRMVLELWSRQQTGAAISMTEEQRFDVQAGLSPLASEQQVQAAYEVMGDVIKTWLRTKAAARPGDARAVVKRGGIDDMRWLGSPEEDVPLPSAHVPATGGAPKKAKPAPAPTGGADEIEVLDPNTGNKRTVKNTPALQERIKTGVLRVVGGGADTIRVRDPKTGEEHTVRRSRDVYDRINAGLLEVALEVNQ